MCGSVHCIVKCSTDMVVKRIKLTVFICTVNIHKVLHSFSLHIMTNFLESNVKLKCMKFYMSAKNFVANYCCYIIVNKSIRSNVDQYKWTAVIWRS